MVWWLEHKGEVARQGALLLTDFLWEHTWLPEPGSFAVFHEFTHTGVSPREHTGRPMEN